MKLSANDFFGRPGPLMPQKKLNPPRLNNSTMAEDIKNRLWIYDLLKRRIKFDKIRLADLTGGLGFLLSPVWNIVIQYWAADLEIMNVLVLKGPRVNNSLPGNLFPDLHGRHIFSDPHWDHRTIKLNISSRGIRVGIENIELLVELLMIPKLDGRGREYPSGIDQITDRCISEFRNALYEALRDSEHLHDIDYDIFLPIYDGEYIRRFSEDRLKMDKYLLEKIMADINVLPAEYQVIVISYWAENIRILNVPDGTSVLVPADKFRDNASHGATIRVTHGLSIEIHGGEYFVITDSDAFTSLFILPQFDRSGDIAPTRDYDDAKRLCFIYLRDELYRRIGS